MKKLMVFVVMSLSTAAFANDVLCVDRTIQDASFFAHFSGIGTASIKVDLFVPAGETAGQGYSGQCTPDQGAIEFAITCNVFTSTDSGYEVRLYSPGDSTLKSAITSWSMAGRGIPTVIPCE